MKIIDLGSLTNHTHLYSKIHRHFLKLMIQKPVDKGHASRDRGVTCLITPNDGAPVVSCLQLRSFANSWSKHTTAKCSVENITQNHRFFKRTSWEKFSTQSSGWG